MAETYGFRLCCRDLRENVTQREEEATCYALRGKRPRLQLPYVSRPQDHVEILMHTMSYKNTARFVHDGVLQACVCAQLQLCLSDSKNGQILQHWVGNIMLGHNK